MAAPVVLSLLGKYTTDNNLDETGFGNYLSSQRGSIIGALGSLPGSLGGMLSGLGLGAATLGNTPTAAAHNVGNTISAATHRTDKATRTTAREVETAVATPSPWPWLLLALWYFMRGCNKTPETAAPTNTEAVTT